MFYWTLTSGCGLNPELQTETFILHIAVCLLKAKVHWKSEKSQWDILLTTSSPSNNSLLWLDLNKKESLQVISICRRIGQSLKDNHSMSKTNFVVGGALCLGKNTFFTCDRCCWAHHCKLIFIKQVFSNSLNKSPSKITEVLNIMLTLCALSSHTE